MDGVICQQQSGLHLWTGPRGPIKWEHCSLCGIIRRLDGKNGPCKGPVKIKSRSSDQLPVSSS